MLLIVMHMQNFVKIHLFILKILSENEIMTSFKVRNSVMNWQKWTLNNPKLDVQDTEQKQKCYGWTDGWTDNLKTVYPPYFVCGGGGGGGGYAGAGV